MPVTNVTGRRPKNMKMMLKRIKLTMASDMIEQFSYNRKTIISPAMRSYLAAYKSIEESIRWKNDYYDLMSKNIERLIAYYKIYDKWKVKKSATSATYLRDDFNKRAVSNALKYIDNTTCFIIDNILLGDTNITEKDMESLLIKIEEKFDLVKERMLPLLLAEKIKE